MHSRSDTSEKTNQHVLNLTSASLVTSPTLHPSVNPEKDDTIACPGWQNYTFYGLGSHQL